MRASQIRLNELVVLPRNAKLHDLDDLEGSFQDFGFVDRAIINSTTGHLLGGHGRCEALARLQAAGGAAPVGIDVDGDGQWLVPCHYVDCPAEREDALAIRLNVSQMRGGEFDLDAALKQFDQDALLGVLDEASRAGWLESSGFNEDALRELQGQLETDDQPASSDPGPQVDIADELGAKWGVEPGQLWTLDSGRGFSHRLFIGDSMATESLRKLMRGDRAVLLWTDPPYGVEIKNDAGMTISNDDRAGLFGLLRAFLAQAQTVLASKSAFYICGPHGAQSHEFGGALLDAGWNWTQTLIWVKSNIVLGRNDYQNKHEVIYYGNLGDGRIWNGGRNKTTIVQDDRPRVAFLSDNEVQIDFGGEVIVVRGTIEDVQRVWPDTLRFKKPARSKYHPTMKPVELVLHGVLNSTNELDIVLDPFCGSGSTLIACETAKRRCRAIELRPSYGGVILERWSLMTGKQPVLASSVPAQEAA